MRKATTVIILLSVAVVSFLAGAWYMQRKTGTRSSAGDGAILYYRDPMHPVYTSDKPGIAPDCGMQLEPVYANRVSTAPGSNQGFPSPPAGVVHISEERQQTIGVRAAPVKKTSAQHTIRVLGRVAVDDTRIYRLNAAVDGWVRETFSNSAGSLVKKDQPLVGFYSPEFLASEQAYLYALGTMDRYQASGQEPPAQIALTKANVQQAVDSLRNLGMGDIQIDEIKRTRQLTQNILLRAPVTGFVLTRNVSPGQRFERGTELYRMADLTHVWIVADVFENEARFIQRAQSADVRYQDRTFHARMSDVLPQFDPAARTLKVRFELDNPGYILRPDMFVDVEMTVRVPAAVTVPVDAVLDSGMHKTVFVDRGGGYFEPRHVETGWRLGDRVAITSGLMPGERIVVSGNFFIDSESRLKLAAAGLPADAGKDPVCGMDVDPGKAGARKVEYRGKTYYFCSDGCKANFEKNPERYAPADKNAPPGGKKQSARDGGARSRGPA